MSTNTTTISDIAALAGVSKTTVSLILSGKGSESFSPETAEKVLRICAETGYTPRRYTKKEKTSAEEGVNNCILLLATKLINPHYAGLVQNLDSMDTKHKYCMIAVNTYFDPEAERRYLEMAYRQKYLAVMYLYSPRNPEAVNRFCKLMPIVALGDHETELPIDTVNFNSRKAGQIAVEYLLEQGHRYFAMLADSLVFNYSREARRQGVKMALSAFAKAHPEEATNSRLFLLTPAQKNELRMSDSDYDYQAGRLLVENLLKSRYPATAVVAINDPQAFGIMDALTERGIRVPEDISVIGFNNLVYSGLTHIPLTTVDVHPDTLARMLYDTLMRRIDSSEYGLQDETFFKVDCQPRLILRASAGPVRKNIE